MSGFLIGVLSSIVAALFIYLARNQIGSVLDFVFRRYFPNISGKYLWIQVHGNDGGQDLYPNQKIYLYFKQLANSVQGHCEVYSGEELKRKYFVKGSISPTRILRITFECQTTEHHDFGVGLFKLDTEGKNLLGRTIVLCATCQSTTTTHVTLKKMSATV